MATAPVNAKSPTIRRILREAQELAAAPSADLSAAPLETDLFEWHFTVRGPPNSAYAGGAYHGRIVLPPSYPLRPPSFRFTTPSGRFEANREICLSISGHHEETWQPAWGLRTALVALRAFMETDPRGQVGGLDASDAVRRRLAAASGAFVCPVCGRSNEAILAASAAAEAAMGGSSGGAAAASSAPEVPPELSLVYRDELTPAARPAQPAQPAQPTQPPSEPAIPPPTPTPTVPQTPVAQPLAPRPLAPRPLAPRPPASDDAVPAWVDRAIVALCAVLAALVLRMVLG